ncbi:MAG: putative phosphoesterase [Bacteroidia bacterium]|jgi:putative phosphoesterase
MRKILLLSDTHSHLDPVVLKYAPLHDELWHAGDWGSIEVFDKLSAIKPVRGVYGNIDGQDLRMCNPKTQSFKIEDVLVLMTHIGGYPSRYKPDFLQQIKKEKPKLVITGHSHILKVVYDKAHNHLHMNPGAMGISGFHSVKTMISFEIEGNNIKNPKVIEVPKLS